MASTRIAGKARQDEIGTGRALNFSCPYIHNRYVLEREIDLFVGRTGGKEKEKWGCEEAKRAKTTGEIRDYNFIYNPYNSYVVTVWCNEKAN